LEKQNIEKEQVEKTLCGRVDELQKKLEELEKKLEEKDSELGRVEVELKSRDEKDRERQEIEAALRNELKETKRRNKNTESNFEEVATILKIKNEEMARNLEELKKKLEEKDSELGRVETELKRRDEKDRERQQIEAALRSKLKETQRRNKNTESHFKEVATILKIENEEMDRNLQELLQIQQVKEREWNNVESALRGQLGQLKKKISHMDRDKKKLVDASKQRHVYEDDEETQRRRFKDLQDEDGVLKEATGPFKCVKDSFKFMMTCQKFYISVFVLFICLGCINRLFNFF
jgi:chromosome segregation ATPase